MFRYIPPVTSTKPRAFTLAHHQPCLLMTWKPDHIRALRRHLDQTQETFGKTLGYGTGAQQRVSELERGVQAASGPLVPLLDCLAEKHGFEAEQATP